MCLTLVAGPFRIVALCARCIIKACEDGEQKNTGKREARTE